MTLTLILFAVATVAGFIDAIAGGGGLLTIPALLLAGLPSYSAIGTNKGQSVFGSGSALRLFWKSPLLDKKRAAISLVPALIGSGVGVLLVSRVSMLLKDYFAPLVMVLLAAAAVLVIVQRPPAHPQPPRHRSALLAGAVAFVIAGYDGFFGPGTGTFLILTYAYLWCDPLDAASANAKVVNFASNLAAFIGFSLKGAIVWQLALPMAAGQLLGGYAGAHMTIRVGRPLVRWMAATVSLALLCRLAWQFAYGNG